MDLKQKRKELKLTQAQIAEKLGISQPQYSQIETGKIQVSKELSDKLTALFNSPIDIPIKEPAISKPKKDIEAIDVIELDPEDIDPEDAEVCGKFKLDFVVSENIRIKSDYYQYILEVNGKKGYYMSLESLLNQILTLKIKSESIRNVQELKQAIINAEASIKELSNSIMLEVKKMNNLSMEQMNSQKDAQSTGQS